MQWVFVPYWPFWVPIVPQQPLKATIKATLKLVWVNPNTPGKN